MPAIKPRARKRTRRESTRYSNALNPNAQLVGAEDPRPRPFARLHRLGRPANDEPRSPTSPRSIRFTDETWDALERYAQRDGITLHALLRTIVSGWLEDQ